MKTTALIIIAQIIAIFCSCSFAEFIGINYGSNGNTLNNPKKLLSGVKYTVKGNNLVVTGDKDGNQAKVEVVGGNVLVNGENTGLAGNDLNNLTIKTKGGDDQVQVSSAFFIRDNLKIITAGGNDKVTIKGGDVDKKTIVKTGGGNDIVNVNDVVFFGPVKIITGGGDDIVFAAVETNGFNAALGGGGGSVTFFEKTKIILGGGNDTLNAGKIDKFSSASELATTLNGSFGTVFFEGSTLLNGSGGTDHMVITNQPTDPATLPQVEGIKIKKFEEANGKME